MSVGKSNKIDPYHLYLGIPREQQPPTLYRLLGLETCEQNSDVIDAAASRQSAYLHQIAAGPNRQEVQKLLTEIAGARRYLLNPQKKATYDSKLQEESNPFGNLAEQLGAIEEVNLADMPLSELMGEPIAPPKFSETQQKEPSHTRQNLGKIVGISVLVVALYMTFSVVNNFLRPTSSDGPDWATGMTLLDGFSTMPHSGFETKIEDPAKFFMPRDSKLWMVNNKANRPRQGRWTWTGKGLTVGQTVGLDFFLTDKSDRTQTVGLVVESTTVRIMREPNGKLSVEVSQPRRKWHLAQSKITGRAILTVTRGAGPTGDKLIWRLTDDAFDIGAEFLVKDLPEDAQIAMDVNIGHSRSEPGSWIDNFRLGRVDDAPPIGTWVK